MNWILVQSFALVHEFSTHFEERQSSEDNVCQFVKEKRFRPQTQWRLRLKSLSNWKIVLS